MSPSVSLLVPCYNAAPFLPRLMDFVGSMTDKFAEILLYDDGSTDQTVSVARELGLNIDTGNSNRGVAFARNRLAEAASHEWIHFHDADDYIAPNYLTVLVPFCAKADVVSCDADWVSEFDQSLQIAWRYEPEALSQHPYRYLLANPMGLNNSIIRRSQWQLINGCDETLRIWEDADVHIRLAQQGALFHHVSAVLTRSLRRPESFSHDVRNSWNFRLAALQSYARDTSSNQVRETLAQQAEFAAIHLLRCGDTDAARRALALCTRMGGRPPTTGSRLLHGLKPFLPSFTLLRLQQYFRS